MGVFSSEALACCRVLLICRTSSDLFYNMIAFWLKPWLFVEEEKYALTSIPFCGGWIVLTPKSMFFAGDE